MKIDVINILNSYLVRVEGIDTKKESERNKLCRFADFLDKQKGFQVTELIFMYAIKEAYIKIYSNEKSITDLQKIINDELSKRANIR